MASDTTRLVFALHFHQPHGNLDEVFADATERCYQPTLELLARHPHVATAIHVSGPLLDWLEQHQPDTIELLRGLVERGQVEVLGGGYQEPMLAILPDRDAHGQLERMADRCEALLGQRPLGMWLAERVWEPDLARPIASAGYRYTLLDDTHLRAAGAAEPLGAYYVTDKAGSTVAVLPIDRGLRTRIPFASVGDLIGYLREQRGRVVTYGDDAEKFGLWPTTERRVWHNGWLEELFVAFADNADWLKTVLPSAMMADTPSAGAIYIPTISYAEMGAWALPAEAAISYQELAQRLTLGGFDDQAERFLRGGIWQAFLAKYPQSNIIYRKMLRVSQLVEQARLRGDPNWRAACDALYRGQCNCAYWHGLFGGLYLQHLRAALMNALLEAEMLVEPRKTSTVTCTDHDGDLADDLLFETPELNLYVTPALGGCGLELDLRRARVHLTGVLARRFEAYHVDVPRAQVLSDEELDNVSAHDLVRATEEGLADKLFVDRHPRGAFVDHLLPTDLDADGFDHAYRCLADLGATRYEIAAVDSVSASAELRADAGAYQLRKRIEAERAGLTARYRLGANRGGRHALRFASEVDITLLSPDAVGGRRIVVLGEPADSADQAPGARCVHSAVKQVRVQCDDMGVDVTLVAEPAAQLWRLPIETVSQSERGFERAYQGTALVFVWDAEVGPGADFEASLSLSVNR